ncbi:GDSL-type esterase/lipase family protein [Fibrobacter sp. UWB13]|uniref:GDSL-type esterase/lipase family protein n=1 Tax=Fibrobacter sp. UWB13 TaxID=1896204 RepID=UPI000A0A5CF1|nr:GDSL-type esterase/lipase family protein [Fibrobacter sp. UWB13]SMG15204.1 Lysophospholipase L1 [Fibrobacter sp. UWB13]
MKKKLAVIAAILGIVSMGSMVSAKDMEITPGYYDVDFTKYDFIDTSLNTIQFPQGSASFEPFFKKLDTLVFENRGKVRILHIGGSHLQADVISGRIREHLVKEYPGASAGRGFVFPYSAARTNTPASYASYYKGIWDKNKNVQHEITKPLGLLGIAISTRDPRAEITLLLDKYNTEPIWGETSFRVFGYSDSNDVEPVLRIDSMDVFGTFDASSQSYVFTSPRPIDTIQIAFRWADTTKQAEVAAFITDSLYKDSVARADSLARVADSLRMDSLGITPPASSAQQMAQAVAADSMFQGDCEDVLDTNCLNRDEDLQAALDSAAADTVPPRPHFTLTGILAENNAPGITYTNVGINGAKVSNYFEETCPLFEKEMSYYKPDLVIFAIGINDANVDVFNDKAFREDYDMLIKRIRKVSPKTAFIFETNNDSYRKVRKKKYVQHPNGEVARKAFFMLADKHKAGVWDKFSIMGGLGSMAKWEKADLAKKDKVHFKTAGYQLLGDMFYKALMQAYFDHIASLPAEAPVVAQAKPAATPTPAPTPKTIPAASSVAPKTPTPSAKTASSTATASATAPAAAPANAKAAAAIQAKVAAPAPTAAPAKKEVAAKQPAEKTVAPPQMPKLAAAAHKDVPMPEVVKQTAQPAQPKIQIPLKPQAQAAESPTTPTPSATDSK